MASRLTKAQRKKREQNRRYQRKHRAEIKRKRRIYAAAHRKELTKAWLDWARRNPEKIAKYRKKKNTRRRQLRREARRAAQKARQ